MFQNSKIYTLSMNPAIDLFIDMDKLEPSIVNRTNVESYKENGKTINISRILKRMDIDSTVLGFIGGFSGSFIKSQLNSIEINTDFIEIDGITRINVFLNAEQEYKIVNKGPTIESNKKTLLLEKIYKIPKDSILFISGSLPVGIDFDIYHEIFSFTQKNNIHLMLDLSDAKIIELLHYRPFIIKPNKEELASFFHLSHELDTDEIVMYSKKIIDLGCQRVLVSLDHKGSIYVDKDVALYINAPTGIVVNTTCAGDTLLGAFIGQLFKNVPLEEALIFASASASSTAFTADITDFKNVAELIKQIKIRKV